MSPIPYTLYPFKNEIKILEYKCIIKNLNLPKQVGQVRVRADLLTEALSEGPQRMLGGGVEGAAGGRVGHAVAAHAADVDDVPVLPSPAHVLHRRPRHASVGRTQ